MRNWTGPFFAVRLCKSLFAFGRESEGSRSSIFRSAQFETPQTKRLNDRADIMQRLDAAPDLQLAASLDPSVQEPFMSAPSRRPEIRRRRTRKEKIVQLRKRLAAVKTDADRTRLTAKLHKLAVMSPGQTLLK